MEGLESLVGSIFIPPLQESIPSLKSATPSTTGTIEANGVNKSKSLKSHSRSTRGAANSTTTAETGTGELVLEKFSLYETKTVS